MVQCVNIIKNACPTLSKNQRWKAFVDTYDIKTFFYNFN
jgi:hypothetical protein